MSDDAAAGDRDARPASPAMPTLGPELDAARAQVAARGLTVTAFAQLTPVVTSLGLSLEALGPVKQLQKRFFSDAPWTRDDDEALADAIGPGVGRAVRHELEPGLTLVWGWEDGRFRLRVVSDAPAAPPNRADTTDGELGQLFEGVVVPEATPSPRTIRFATPPIHAGPGRAYAAATADADPRVARIFRAFDDVTDVLVGPDFVAVTISRPGRWESLLGPMLRAVSEEFTAERDGEPPPPRRPPRPRAIAAPIRGRCETVPSAGSKARGRSSVTSGPTDQRTWSDSSPPRTTTTRRTVRSRLPSWPTLPSTSPHLHGPS